MIDNDLLEQISVATEQDRDALAQQFIDDYHQSQARQNSLSKSLRNSSAAYSKHLTMHLLTHSHRLRTSPVMTKPPTSSSINWQSNSREP